MTYKIMKLHGGGGENKPRKKGRFVKNKTKTSCTNKNDFLHSFNEQTGEKKMNITDEKKTVLTDGNTHNQINIISPDQYTNCQTFNTTNEMNYGIIARGSYHQGDYRFRELAGKQCVSNSLIAMLYCKIKDGNEFKTFDLDEILLLGSELYYFIQKDSSMNEELLMVSELPKELHILNNSFEMKYSEGLYGTLEGTDEGAFLYGTKSLGQALEYELCKYDACFMTFYGSTFAIIKRPTGYFIFDSHSRNNEGVLTENGRSVLLYFSSWQGIHKHCLTLAKSMNCPLHATQFELTGMNVSLKSNKDENEYDLHINASRATNHSEQDTGVDNLFDDIVIDIESHIDKNESFDANKYSKAPTLDENDTLFGNIESHIKENESFETNKCSNPPTLDDSEIIYVSTEVITERTDKYFKYLPLQVHSKELLCHKLGIDYNGSNFDTPFDHEHEYITKPTSTKKITGDGNCFYRTIAYLISGTERNHSVLRKANVKHMLETNDRFKCTLDTERYKNVKQYVVTNEIMNSGTWACDTDIVSMANMLDLDIYAYNDQTKQWQIFSARKPGYYNKITTERGIYILYTGGNHFEAITAVSTISESNDVKQPEVLPVNNHLKSKASINEIPYIKSKKRKTTTSYEETDKNLHCFGEEFESNSKKIKTTWVDDIDKTNHEKTLTTKKRKRKQSDAVKRQLSKEKMKAKRIKKHGQNEQNIKTSRKEKNANAMKKKYQTDINYKLKTKCKEKGAQRDKYQNHPDFKEKKKTIERDKYQTNPDIKEKKKTNQRNKYQTNPDFKEKNKADQRHKYQTNPDFKEKSKANKRHKYQNNPDFKEKSKVDQRHKYQNNPDFKEKSKADQRHKYQTNPDFKEKSKADQRHKYQTNIEFKNKTKDDQRHKYQNNTDFREKFKQNMTSISKQKYQNNPQYKQKVLDKNLKRRQCKKSNKPTIECVIKNFRKSISHGPEYVCCVCLKLLFENQVIKCIKAKYKIQSCINESYLHTCNSECNDECEIAMSSRHCLWICYTCHRKLIKAQIPSEAYTNNLKLQNIPHELETLNNLEQHLIAINIPFMKIMHLPKGGQQGIHGPVVCVPSNTVETVNVLPRPETDDQMIRVKLKRKLSYKGHYEYKYVNKTKVLQALQYLHQNNKWYSDVVINEEWNNVLPDKSTDLDNKSLSENEDEEDDFDSRLSGIQLDTCLQPTDMRQEILDHYFDDIFCCAPCEGNSPVALLNNKSLEGKCFPTLFPTGHSTFHDARNIKLTLGRYFHNKLCHVDNRFAKNTEYIFFAQCLYEIQQVLSSVSIALRKSSGKKDDFSSVKASDFKSASKVQEILQCDRGYKFLKQIRGTCPYWQSTQKDVLAMVRQLGKPTWFASFSSADMRWPEVMKTLLLETGDKRNINELEWADKCTLLKSNPVTVARMFDKRFHNFLRKVILSDAHPIGKVIDYFYRVEYQARGSPHIHMILWVENAPQLGIDENEKVTEFIDQYVSCRIPSLDEDKELHEIVFGVQTHCKRHSKSCKKKGTTCRFNFPKPPSERTFVIQRKIPDDDNNDTDINDTDGNENAESDAIKSAKELLNSVKSALIGETTYDDTKQLFEYLNITQQDFEDANNLIATKDDFLLQRNPQDAWVNQYNPSLLRAWNANMDLQFVSNEYACVAYVVSYMSKAEREMGLLLSQAETEIKDGNEDAKQSLRKLGNVYMQNREVSAQESVYRVCNLRLKEGSRKVEFIPVGPNPVRLSLPINVIQTKDDDDEITWLPSKLDKYKSRPDGPDFEKMCLATFCSEYRILSSSEINGNKKKQNTFKLKDKLGYIQKRTRSSNAVIRYPRFKQNIAPEKYFMSIMQLFLPFRTDQQLKPPSFLTYEDFFEKGSVKLFGDDLQTVSSIVTENMQQYERNADAIEEAQKYIDTYGPPEDAWGLLCPENEINRLENPKPSIENDDEQDGAIIPDLEPKKKELYRFEHTESRISKQESNNLIRSLNDKQQQVFYQMRQWCLNKVNGKQPEPIHVFITGGAGVGKSHLVKCIYNEGTRILGKMMHNPDDVSILKVAPTGIAAYNINGKTIHSALSIPINASLPYQPLGEEKITQLRNQLGQLQILIIDEISMVDQKMLWYIHGRLRQIKQVRDDSPFGNVSVLAVGDFFQLPPVKGSALYKESLQNILWIDNFKQVQLNEIMRQKEDAKFATLLNRLRTKEKEHVLSNEDLQTLKSCETGEDCEEAIHIYSYNKDVFAWNKQMLHKKCTDIICIEAEDTEMNSRKKNTIRDKPIKKSNQCSLPSYLWVAPNARIMLIKNVDVSKGMTNGCMGNVTEITQPDEHSKPTSIKIKFDNQVDIQSIERYQESMGKKYNRKQFPLKLAYACTVHKVQGMTMNKAVVNLKNTFLSGQAYVGLSRVTSLTGLYIENFDPKHIRCDPTIKTCLSNMKPFLQPNKHRSTVTNFQYCITLHNIQGLRQHLDDMKCNTSFANSDFICLTETWINDNNINNICMENFKLYHQPRCQSYSNDNTITSELKNKEHGGVAVYTKNKSCSRLNINFKDIEFISFMVTSPMSVIITVIYRPPIYDIKKFCNVLENLLAAIHTLGTRSIIMGDFNEDLLKGTSHVNNLLAKHNYQQLIQSSTTEGGTLLDHVYVRNLDTVHTEVIPIYYSYHEIIKIKL